MSEGFAFSVGGAQDGQRLDSFLGGCFSGDAQLSARFTRSYIQRLIESGRVLVNGRAGKKSLRVSAGDVVELEADVESAEILPEDIPLQIVYEDDCLLVVNKPKGMVVHPAPGNPRGTLVNALMFHCGDRLSGVNGVERPGIVHRIDKDTSGLLVVAKDDFAHLSLSQQVAGHSMTRVYSAVAHGRFSDVSGTVDLPIGRSDRDRKKFCVTEKNSKNAVTHYRVIAQYRDYTYLELRLETGRTHQIRVHMAHIGHPLAGDTVYGPKNTPKSLCGQCLHAGVLGFKHPKSGRYIEFSAPLPDYFENFLSTLRYSEE